MAASHETEIKLAVSGVQALRRRLKSLGFRVVEARHFESNRVYDFDDLRLRKKRCLLRLRLENAHCLVTFKGAPLDSRAYKIRSEIETYVADGKRMGEIFGALGFGQKFRYDKYRTTFARRRDKTRAPKAVAELDETPIGAFLELEGPKRWIDEVALGLGYAPEDYITSSYGTLFFEWCRRHGRRAGNMVFNERNK
jgi:adenylate cyclase, class 2